MAVKTKKESNDISSTYMLGVLAVNEERYPGIEQDQSAITLTRSSGDVVFYLRPISDAPQPIIEIDDQMNSDLFIGFNSSIQGLKGNQLPLEYNWSSDEKKMNMIQEALKNKIVLFQPFLKIDEKRRSHRNLVIRSIENVTWKGENFTQIPTIHYLSPEEFEKKIQNQEPVVLTDYSQLMREPEYIICGDYLYNFTLSPWSPWKGTKDRPDTWVQARKGIVKRVKNKKLNLKDVIAVNEYLNFVGFDTLYSFKKEIDDKGFDITSYPSIAAAVAEKIPVIQGQQKTSVIEEPKKEQTSLGANNEELSFLKRFEHLSLKNELYYRQKDLINFHVSVKTNQTTVLAGISGNGKTKLALAYASTLGLKQEDKNLLIVPISPSYTEPADILGYLNASNGLYNPSETGIVEFLLMPVKIQRSCL